MNTKSRIGRILIHRLFLVASISLLTFVGSMMPPANTSNAEGDLVWSFVNIPDMPEGAVPSDLWTDRPGNLYVWVEDYTYDPVIKVAAYLYHWDGLNWNIDLEVPGYAVGLIHGNGPNDIFATVSCPYAEWNCTGRPRIFHFNGSSWSEQVLPPEVGVWIRSISGVPGEVQAIAYGINQNPIVWIRYDYSSASWNYIYSHLEGAKDLTFISANEGYYTTCWGHGRWDGISWTFKKEFDFCDIEDTWGQRDESGQLHLYTVGANNWANGVRVWKYSENANPALLGTFGSKCGFDYGDPIDGDFICGGVYHIGYASGIWGSDWNNVYVTSRRGDIPSQPIGRIYHYDGISWHMLEFGTLPIVEDVWGSGPDDVWFSLVDGRLLHIGPLNTSPELTVDAGEVTFSESEMASNTGTVSDENGDIVSLTTSVGTVTNNGDGTWFWNLQTVDGPAQSQTVTITADDLHGGVNQMTFALTISNVPPVIDSISVPIDPVDINAQPITASAVFNDPANAYDAPYSCRIDYGDGSGTLSGSVSDTTCVGPAHTYAEPGVYAVTVTVMDKDGASDSAAATNFIVIYDPEDGFVTGGGWIWSLPGAYHANPDLEGIATFGFVSKYLKGANLPSGSTEFQFHAGDLNFRSTSYVWLVVNKSDSNAQFMGYGTINGTGTYGFMIWASDGLPDSFRIKIWVAGVEGNVIYDNGTNQPLGGGNIVVHTK